MPQESLICPQCGGEFEIYGRIAVCIRCGREFLYTAPSPVVLAGDYSLPAEDIAFSPNDKKDLSVAHKLIDIGEFRDAARIVTSLRYGHALSVSVSIAMIRCLLCESLLLSGSRPKERLNIRSTDDVGTRWLQATDSVEFELDTPLMLDMAQDTEIANKLRKELRLIRAASRIKTDNLFISVALMIGSAVEVAICYLGARQSIVIPPVVSGNNVMLSKIFALSDSVHKLKISDDYDAIGPGCFRGCKCVDGVFLGKKVKKIYPYAFEGMKKLLKISLPSTCEKISSDALGKKTSCLVIELFGIKNADRYICRKIVHMHRLFGVSCFVLRDVNEIGRHAFADSGIVEIRPLGFSGLKEADGIILILPRRIISIGQEAFARNDRLIHANVSCVESVAGNAFNGCIQLKEVEIGKNTITIGKMKRKNVIGE